MMKFIGYALLSSMFLTGAFAANLPRVEGSVKIDGDLSDPIWQQALQVDRFYDVRSAPNGEPPVRTIAFAAYDSHYLYIGFRAYDPAPARIRASQVPRDQVYGDQDMVQIDLDAQDDGKSSSIFRVNARGVQTDGIYTEATEQDDYSPDFDFDSAARITADRWEAEMRIPLASIRYAHRDPQSWRIVFYRVYPREQRYRFRSAPIERGQTCWLCSAPRYDGITGLARTQSVVVTPYATTRATSPPDAPSSRSSDTGLDLKWLARPSLSFDATLRPDFSQVEADVTQLSVNQRFAIFYPEKRPFFMEGADLLSSPIQAINTRTITSPLWGTRLTGRPGNHAFTLIAAGDRGGGSTILPGPVSSSFDTQPKALTIFGRYRYGFGVSSAGFLFTSRSGEGKSNRVLGPDLLWWPSADDRVTTQFLMSSTAGRRGHAAFASWDRTATHYLWNVTLQEIGKDFRADSGFVPQTGVRTISVHPVGIAYPTRHLTKLMAGLLAEHVQEISGGLVSQSVVPKIFVEGWRGTTAEVAFHPKERLRALDGTVQSQNYITTTATFFPSTRIPIATISGRFGEEIDLDTAQVGRGRTLAAEAHFQPSGPFYVELIAQMHRLNIEDKPLFDANALSTRLTWAFTNRSLVRVIGDAQRISLAGGDRRGFFDTTVLYAYRLTWESSIYVGYGDSRLARSSGRYGPPRKEVFVKASYAVRKLIGG